MFQHRVDMRQTGLWTTAHGNCHGTIQLYNWRRLNSYQLVVKRNNLPPVGRSDRFRLGMNGRNRLARTLNFPQPIVTSNLVHSPSLEQ
jgi:hypothetical protein